MQSSHRHSRLTPGWARLLRSTVGRVTILLLILVVVANVGASVALSSGNHDAYLDALWWSMSSLMDPGSLSDDDAWDERIAGLGLTIIGMVVLLGIVIEVVTNTLANSLRRLDEIDTEVRARGHIVVYGWSTLLPGALARIPRPREVAVIAPSELRSDRGGILAEIRFGAPHITATVVFDEGHDDPACFVRANLAEAACVLVHRDDQAGEHPDTLDVDVVQRTFRVKNFLEQNLTDTTEAPAVLYDVIRARNVDVAAPLLPGYDAIVVDRMITGAIALGMDAPGWSASMPTLFSDRQGSLQVAPAGNWAGATGDTVALDYPGDLPIAAVGPDGQPKALTAATVIADDDHLAVLSRPDAPAPSSEPNFAVEVPRATPTGPLTLLLVGWNDRTPVFLEEFAEKPDNRPSIVSFAALPAERRRAAVPTAILEKLDVEFIEGDPTSSQDLGAVLERCAPDVVVVGATYPENISDPEMLRRQADAQAVLSVLVTASREPTKDTVVVADLPRAHPTEIYRGTDRINVIPTTGLRSALLGRLLDEPLVGLLREAIFEHDTFKPDTITFRPSDGAAHSFHEIRAAYLKHGVVVANVLDGSEPEPAPAGSQIVQPDSELLVLRIIADET